MKGTKTGKEGQQPKSRFATALLRWNATENDRDMPWKGEKDPYRIWLSEVILQQTRVGQGRAYYERFIETFPTVRSLATAPETTIFKLWEGLGYYSRCRNLIAAARKVVTEEAGNFPNDYDSILALPGVGPYTAAAIASFAFNLPHAVVDGNVYRVLARIFNNDTPIDSTEGKKWFAQKAQELLPHDRPGEYNQALMDFGATLCKPVPECARCFFQADCGAYQHGRQAVLPVKAKKTAVRDRWFHYILLQSNGAVALHARGGKDIWQDLWEPLLVEASHVLSREDLFAHLENEYAIDTKKISVISAGGKGRQRLSHQVIHFAFLHLELPSQPRLESFEWIPLKKISDLPYPKTVGDFLKNLGSGSWELGSV